MSPKVCHQVGDPQAGNRQVAGATGPVYVQRGVWSGSMYSSGIYRNPRLTTIVFEALFKEFRAEFPLGMLTADILSGTAIGIVFAKSFFGKMT